MITDVPVRRPPLHDHLGRRRGGGGFPTVTNARTAKAVPQGSCTPIPTATSTFSSTDAAVYVFFNVSGQASGETLTRVWYSPDGEVAASGSWISARVRRRLLPLGEPADRRVRPGQLARDLEGPRLLEHDHRRPVRRPHLHDHLGRRRRRRLPDVTNAMTAKSVPQGPARPCRRRHAFSSTDAAVYVFFNISGQANGETLTRVWYSPDGEVAASGQLDCRSRPAAATASRPACRSPGPAAASWPGTWRVQRLLQQDHRRSLRRPHLHDHLGAAEGAAGPSPAPGCSPRARASRARARSGRPT